MFSLDINFTTIELKTQEEIFFLCNKFTNDFISI